MRSCSVSDELACAADSTNGGLSQALNFEALPAGDYLVRVAGQTASDTGSYSLSAEVTPAPAAPVSSCGAPLPLSFSNGVATASGSVSLAANNVASCGSAGGETMGRQEPTWYRTAPAQKA